MKKYSILIVLPFFPYPLSSGGHQAVFNGIVAVKDDMDVTLLYKAEDNEAYHLAEKEFCSKFPNINLCPLFHKSVSKARWQGVVGIAKFIRKKLSSIQSSKINWGDEGLTELWKSTVTPSSREWVYHFTDIVKHNKFDIIQVEMPWALSDIFMLPPEIKKVYVHHELGFVRRDQEIRQVQGCGAYADTIRKFADFNEIGQLNLYDAVITLSPNDKQKLIDKGVVKPIYSSFAIIDTPPLEKSIVGDGKRLVFIGSGSHFPNLVGILWFLDNCWPRLKSLDSEMSLDIIGDWDASRMKEYSEKYAGINFLGFVDDLKDVIQGSTMIVPITVGSGIRMKILEASSRGVPFVSTTVGAEGIPVEDGRDCFLADDPESFVQDILKLRDTDTRQKFIFNAYQMVKTLYSPEALRKNRLTIYEKVLTS